MKDKIFAGLKTKFPGVQDAILNRVADKLSKTVTTDDQVETAVSGVEFQQVLDAYGDSRANEATLTSISNYEKKHGIRDGKAIQAPAGGDPEKTEIPADAPEWAKAILKQNQDMAAKLTLFEKTGQKETLIGKLTEKLQGKVPAAYLKGRTIEIENESQIEAMATTIEADYMELTQEQTNSGLVIGAPSGGNKDVTAASVESDIKNLAGKF